MNLPEIKYTKGGETFTLNRREPEIPDLIGSHRDVYICLMDGGKTLPQIVQETERIPHTVRNALYRLADKGLVTRSGERRKYIYELCPKN